MITLDQVIYILPILALTASILYYALNLRAANKPQQLQLETRQAQLFMTLYETYRSTEFRKQWTDILKQEYTNFNDFWEKYGLENKPEAWASWQSVASFFHGIGVLVKKQLIEPSLLDELISPNVFGAWVVMGPIVKAFQEWVQNDGGVMSYQLHDYDKAGVSRIHKSWSGFEYLYDTLKEREQQQMKNKDYTNR
jgi:hypothetical protein